MLEVSLAVAATPFTHGLSSIRDNHTAALTSCIHMAGGIDSLFQWEAPIKNGLEFTLVVGSERYFRFIMRTKSLRERP